MYALGIDLGTAFTAAATWRSGHAEMASLGSRTASIPSVVLLREDESFMTGEAANRRALLQPSRVAREFKRRFGDSTPLLLGGSPHSAESLMAKLLAAVVEDISVREAEAPASVCVCHPANWGPYKVDLLRQAVRMADIHAPTEMLVEPVAAAGHYARQTRIEPGALVAVYDLGGGTFDAAVLRKTSVGFDIIGQPEGIEHLGGSDFDAAVFAHVRTVVGAQLDALDPGALTTVAAVARLRQECTEAKETLSSDTDTSIPVLLPNFSTQVRLTREELERMVRPSLYETIAALQRAIRGAGVQPEDLHSVLLIGGSSRMPLVAQLVGAEIGRPVAVDAHPKHAVALGAAWVAGERMTGSRPSAPPRPASSDDPRTAATPPAGLSTTAPAKAGALTAGAALASGIGQRARTHPPTAAPDPASAGAGVSDIDHGRAGTVRSPVDPQPASTPTDRPAALAAPPGPVPPGWLAPQADPGAPTPPWPPGVIATQAGVPPAGGTPDRPARGGARITRHWIMVAAALTTTAVVVLVGAYFAGAGHLFSGTSDTPAAVTGAASAAAPPTPSSSGAAPSIYTCPTDATAALWGCLTQATVTPGKITLKYTANFTLSPVQDATHFHFHLWLANPGPDGGTVPAANLMQRVPGHGSWVLIYSNAVTVIDANTEQGGTQLGLQTSKYTLLCVRVATGLHGLIQDKSGGLRTGNCVKLT